MKKLLLLIAALSLFAASCSSDTTVEAGSDDSETETSASTTDPETSVDTADDDPADQDADDDGDDELESGVQATDPTAAPAPTTPAGDSTDPSTDSDTADSADDAATDDDSDDDSDGDTTGPVEPAPGQAEAVQAVVDAGDWCEAAAAVEVGTASFDTLNFTDPVELEQGLNQSLAVVSASQALVPDEIADDLEQSISGFTALAAALEDVNYSFLDLDLAAIGDIDGPMELATYNIELYNFTECGIGTDPGEPPVILEDGTVEDDGLDPDDQFQFEGSVREQVVLSLVDAGFTEAEASCITDNLDLTDPASFEDVTELLAVFTDCGIPLERLAQLGE